MLWKKLDLSTNDAPFTITTNFVYIPLDTTTKPFRFYSPAGTPLRQAPPKPSAKKRSKFLQTSDLHIRLRPNCLHARFPSWPKKAPTLVHWKRKPRTPHPGCGKAAGYPQDQMCRTTVLKTQAFFVQVSCKLDASFVQQVNDCVSA